MSKNFLYIRNPYPNHKNEVEFFLKLPVNDGFKIRPISENIPLLIYNRETESWVNMNASWSVLPNLTNEMNLKFTQNVEGPTNVWFEILEVATGKTQALEALTIIKNPFDREYINNLILGYKSETNEIKHDSFAPVPRNTKPYFPLMIFLISAFVGGLYTYNKLAKW